MNRKFIYNLPLAVFLVVSMLSWAGPTKITAKLDSTTLLMGKVVGYNIEIVQDKDKQGYILMNEGDTLTKNVEIHSLKLSDTVDLDNNRVQINKTYLLQSFDSGLYALPPVLYVSGKDTFASASTSLKVLPAEVDSLKNIHDYKTVMVPERKWYDFLPDFVTDYWWVPLVLLLIAAIVVFIIYRIKKGKPLKISLAPKKKILPPYDEAVLALQNLKARGLWQGGQEKEYYSEMTDIIRHYIDRRFNVNAMEMTTTQIMDLLNNEEVASSRTELREILSLADFVKFAKFKPLADENEQVFRLAQSFLEKTKPVEVESSEEDKNDNKEK